MAIRFAIRFGRGRAIPDWSNQRSIEAAQH